MNQRSNFVGDKFLDDDLIIQLFNTFLDLTTSLSIKNEAPELIEIQSD